MKYSRLSWTARSTVNRKTNESNGSKAIYVNNVTGEEKWRKDGSIKKHLYENVYNV